MDFLDNMYSAYKSATSMLDSANTGTQQTNFSGVETPGAPQGLTMPKFNGVPELVGAPQIEGTPSLPNGYNAYDEETKRRQAAEAQRRQQMAMGGGMGGAGGISAPTEQPPAPTGAIPPANYALTPSRLPNAAAQMGMTGQQPATEPEQAVVKQQAQQIGKIGLTPPNQMPTGAVTPPDYSLAPTRMPNAAPQMAAPAPQMAAPQVAAPAPQVAAPTAISPAQSQAQAAKQAAAQQSAAAQMGPQLSLERANIPELQPWSMFHTAANSRDPNTIVNAIKEIKDPYQKAELQNQLADIAGFQRNTNNAEQAVQSAIQSGNPRELNKALTDKNYGKIALAYLASIFGMKELGRDLAAEGGLGEFNVYGETTIGDHTASIVSAPNGRTLRGVWNSGPNVGKQLTESELQQTYGDLGAGGGKITKPEVKQAVEYVGTDDKLKGQGGVVVSQMKRNGTTETYVESGGKKYPYKASDWRSPKEGEAMRRMDYSLITDLNKKHGTNVLDAEKDYVALNGPMSPEQRDEFRKRYAMTSGMIGQGTNVKTDSGAGTNVNAGTNVGAGGTVTTDTVARVQRDVASIQRELALPNPVGATQTQVDQRKAILNKELTDRQAWLAANAPNAVSAPAGGAGASAGGASAGGNINVPLSKQQAKAEAYKKELVESAQEVGTDIGKLKVNQSKSEQNADYLTTKIDQLVKHPGFSVSVGASAQPGFQFIPGTDKASWYSRFQEIKGQAFLQAIENLRGLGSLSNDEGKAATGAIQRMSTSQSEAEFKEAAQDFQNIVKRGIDRNRVKLGQDIKYGVQEESEIQQAKETPAGTTSSGNKFKRVQ
ncbi:hypothetical protein UFOVP180_22 [uncultured Caudovirales phage]|uniref:Uncharacterized protein n=1 Tax=uncultured Caudovirales phage TaxID=2100421 RepID=A0A6J7WDF8_9CAUD|nr:hypothetical protein UFOVP180_22 [uncultured Caudovirales phage]